jgi:hypothetical protein
MCFRRIEADTAKPPCRVITETVRDEAVRGLVERYGDDHGYRPDRYCIDYVAVHSFA